MVAVVTTLRYSTDLPKLTLVDDGIEHHFELDVDVGAGFEPEALRLVGTPDIRSLDLGTYWSLVDHMIACCEIPELPCR